MPNVRKVASALHDISGLKSSRYEKLQISYGTVGGTSFAGVGEINGTTLTISEVFAGTVTIANTGVLTLVAVTSGKLIAGAPIIGPGIAPGTYVTGSVTNGGNTPGTTTCNVSVIQTVATPTAVTCGSLKAGDVLNITTPVAGEKAYVVAQTSGTSGAAGTYTLSATNSVGSGSSIIAGDYGFGETLTFVDVPSQDIIKATVVAHTDATPASLDVYPASNKAGIFQLSLPTAIAYVPKLSYIIEYIRGGGRVASTTESGEGDLFRVSVATLSGLTAADAEVQISETE
jgi:hypothetical protein